MAVCEGKACILRENRLHDPLFHYLNPVPAFWFTLPSDKNKKHHYRYDERRNLKGIWEQTEWWNS